METPIFENVAAKNPGQVSEAKLFRFAVPRSGTFTFAQIDKAISRMPCRPPFDNTWVELAGEYRAGVYFRKVSADAEDARWWVHVFYPDGTRGGPSVPLCLPDSGGSTWSADGTTDEEAEFAIAAALLCLVICHCKNVTVEEHQLSRGARRRLASQLPNADQIRVRTLRIAPFSTEKSAAAAHRGSGPAYVPFHLVRGHFATYTDDKPLFGRYVGTFWVEAHARGNKGFGTIEHDYDVRL